MTTNSPAPGTPQTPTKAVLAFVLSLVGALVAAVAGREDTLGNLNGIEWLVVVATAVVTAGATYAVPNSARR